MNGVATFPEENPTSSFKSNSLSPSSMTITSNGEISDKCDSSSNSISNGISNVQLQNNNNRQIGNNSCDSWAASKSGDIKITETEARLLAKLLKRFVE